MARLSPLLVLTAAVAVAASGLDLPPQLTLSEALNIALSHSTTVRETLARLDQASGQYQQARSTLVPQLGVAVRQSYQTENLIGIGIDIPEAARGLIGRSLRWMPACQAKLADEFYFKEDRVKQVMGLKLGPRGRICQAGNAGRWTNSDPLRYFVTIVCGITLKNALWSTLWPNPNPNGVRGRLVLDQCVEVPEAITETGCLMPGHRGTRL